jgi:hypothetical protein
MTSKITSRKVILIVLALAVLFVAICFTDSLRYPRIARSAYWRHPYLLVRATLSRVVPGKGVSRKAILAHAGKLGYGDGLSVRLLYLPDLPTDEKTIKDRVFCLVRKEQPYSKERLFWIVTPYSHGCIINDYTIAYEYRTGRLVYIEDTSRVGELAIE